MMGPAYLTGERLSLRAPVTTDAEVAAAWFPSVFPVGAGRAESYLKDKLKSAWWPDREFHLMIVRIADDQVVGSLIVEHPTGPGAIVTIKLTPALSPSELDETQADTLRILIPWLLDEAEALTVTVGIGADEPRSLDAAHDLGMETAIRLREFLARPGGRVDLIQAQALHPRRAAMVPSVTPSSGGD